MLKLLDEVNFHEISTGYNMIVNDSIKELITNYIQSFTYAFETAYQSCHEVIDDVIIFHYGQEFINSPSEVVPYHSIVFSHNKTPEEIQCIVKDYAFKGDGSFAIYQFHEDMNPQNLKIRYRQLGYEYYLPNILQITRLPAKIECADFKIQAVSGSKDADTINLTFKDFNPFPERIIGRKRIKAIYAVVEQKAAGWCYLVQNNSTSAYIAGMFTLPEYRRRGIATAMLNSIHGLAYSSRIEHILLVPSFMAWKFYTRRGYETIAHFSTFMPSVNEDIPSLTK